MLYYIIYYIIRSCFSAYMRVTFKTKKTSASQLELSQIPFKNILFSKTKSQFQMLALSR